MPWTFWCALAPLKYFIFLIIAPQKGKQNSTDIFFPLSKKLFLFSEKNDKFIFQLLQFWNHVKWNFFPFDLSFTKETLFECFIMKVNETCSEETNAGGNGRGYIRWVKCRFLASAEGTAAVFMSYSSLLVLASLISWVPGLKHNQEVQQSWFFNSVSWPSWRNEDGSACDTVNNRRDVAHVFIYSNSV